MKKDKDVLMSIRQNGRAMLKRGIGTRMSTITFKNTCSATLLARAILASLFRIIKHPIYAGQKIEEKAKIRELTATWLRIVST